MKIRDATFLASADIVTGLPAPVFAEIAFAGRSNVGKSTLMNGLLERKKLVRTSGKPGCTRALNLFRIETLEPEATIDFVDLPGYGYARRSKTERKAWGELIEKFLVTRPGLRAVVCIVDVRRGFERDDRELLEFLNHIKLRSILVATKLDKLPKNEQKLAVQAVTKAIGRPVHGVSGVKRDGLDKLWRTLLRAASIGETDGIKQKL
ncbi:MAG: YihA family ribosome biogenesis GTP-binding protein [Deltaproteobacteria bacterium]|nr:YihA family ribosome biogenesis GTP-binding protein [Deltaproteobacteria bacterium]